MHRLIIIPARGGSKGVPRKNLRPLAGRPLVAHAMEAALQVGDARVLVSTEDEEIALIAERAGAEIHHRPVALAADATTLDELVVNVVAELAAEEGYEPEIVITVQPTAPLLVTEDILAAIRMLEDDPSLETVITVTEDKHLRWQRNADGAFTPAYEARVNRQMLPDVYRETGSIVACRTAVLSRGTRIGTRVSPLIIPPERSIDIDRELDFQIAESILGSRTVVFTVIGSPETGTGHAFRALLIAQQLLGHRVVFVVEERDTLAYRLISEAHFTTLRVPNGDRLRAVLDLRPDLVINDVLDTEASDVLAMQAAGARVCNFEDKGTGIEHADLVVNALYGESPRPNVLAGPAYFCLREEFLSATPRPLAPEVSRVLLAFGGVDEGNLTARCLRVLGPLFLKHDISVDVVLGPGFSHHAELPEEIGRSGSRVAVHSKTRRISDYMRTADLAITSGGRTVLELASLGTPTIVVCQNERETTHTFASPHNGVINLGLRTALDDAELHDRVTEVVGDLLLRESMRERMTAMDLRQGRARVMGHIHELLTESPARTGGNR